MVLPIGVFYLLLAASGALRAKASGAFRRAFGGEFFAAVEAVAKRFEERGRSTR
jgi:hypothetical protein